MFYDSHGRLAPIEMIHEIGTSSLIDIFNLIMNYTFKKKKNYKVLVRFIGINALVTRRRAKN